MAVKYKKSQIFILSMIAALLSATPFLSASIRSAYHYFIVNLLIVALGAEAGLLSSSLLKPAPSKEEDKKIVSASSSPDPKTKIVSSSSSSKDHYSMRNLTPVSTSASSDYIYSRVSAHLQGGCNTTTITGHELTTNSENCGSRMNNTVKKFATANICIDGNICKAIKNQSPSPPSIFFIETEDAIYEEEGEEEDEEEEVAGGISEQELYAKAEAFIGNFYEQLKMQRQESWNRIQTALQQQ